MNWRWWVALPAAAAEAAERTSQLRASSLSPPLPLLCSLCSLFFLRRCRLPRYRPYPPYVLSTFFSGKSIATAPSLNFNTQEAKRMKINFHITCGPLEGEEHTLNIADEQSTLHSLLLPGGALYDLGANYCFHDLLEFRLAGAVLPPSATVGSIAPASASEGSPPVPRVYLVRARQQLPPQPQPPQPQPSQHPPAAPCPICFEPTPPHALARFHGCSCAACSHCVFASMHSAFQTSDSTILKCQMTECVKNHGPGGRTLDGDEVRQFLRVYAEQHAKLGGDGNIDPTVCSCGGGSSRGVGEHSRSCCCNLPRRMQQHQEHVLNMVFFHKCKGHVVCPCGANQMIDPAHADVATPIPCPKCSESFCSCCKRKPFHYGLPCDRAEEVRGGYLEWQNQRRQAVLQHLEKIDARFKTELQQRDRRVQEELERLQQLRGVMCCPHCNHPCGEIGEVRCGKFICGRLETDSAASAVAGGCGREFKMTDARPFKADIPAALREPLRKDIAKWRRSDGQPLRCECCDDAIEGPLLQCVGCNGLSVCIRCDAKGHEHVRHASQHPCHNESHYFVIRMNPDSEQAASFTAPASSSSSSSSSAAAAAAAVAAADDVHDAEVTAHVFREDGKKTMLRSHPTTSRDDSVMVVPKASVCNGERVVILGHPEEAEASGAARSSDLFVLVRLDSGSIGYINMRYLLFDEQRTSSARDQQQQQQRSLHSEVDSVWPDFPEDPAAHFDTHGHHGVPHIVGHHSMQQQQQRVQQLLQQRQLLQQQLRQQLQQHIPQQHPLHQLLQQHPQQHGGGSRRQPGVVCPSGHLCQDSFFTSRHFCNLCRRDLVSEHGLRCQPCDWDVCRDCAAADARPGAPQRLAAAARAQGLSQTGPEDAVLQLIRNVQMLHPGHAHDDGVNEQLVHLQQQLQHTRQLLHMHNQQLHHDPVDQQLQQLQQLHNQHAVMQHDAWHQDDASPHHEEWFHGDASGGDSESD